jgi:hypothetical protein
MSQFINAHDLLSDNNPAFGRYMEAFHFEQLGKTVGLEMKVKHTVIAKWPMRLPKRPTKREFEVLYWSGHQGSERYVEWCRVWRCVLFWSGLEDHVVSAPR